MTPDSLLFRPAQAEDGRPLLTIHQRAIRELAGAYYDADTITDWLHGLTPDGYARQVALGEYIEIAAWKHRPIAFCGTRGAEVTGLFVHPDASRNGIGSRLLARAVDRLMREGHETLTLSASLASVDFYAKAGWVETGRGLRPTRGGRPMMVVDMAYSRAA